MKLSAYFVKHDTGFAPNPFGRHCTLACCKPSIRRHAETNDIIVGTASARYEQAGKLVFAMRVKDVIPIQKYWDNQIYEYKKPSTESEIKQRGDNIWHQDAQDNWRVVQGAFHGEDAKDHDTGGKNVLIATRFFYFGREAIAVPRPFSELLATTQGHKNSFGELVERFWSWIESKYEWGRIGHPIDFEVGCCVEPIESEWEKPIKASVEA